MASKIRSSIDLGRLAAAARRPGIDPRVWFTRAVVTDVAFAPDQGLFADVQFQPDGDIETVLVGAAYAGDDFGSYWPVKVDDIVLVALPHGDPGEGGMIISRMFTGSEKPPKELSANDAGVDGSDPTTDPTLRLEDGTTMRIVGKKGAGYKIELDGAAIFEIAATGGSKVVIAADTTVEITGTSEVTIASNVSIKLGANAKLGNARLNDPVVGAAVAAGSAPTGLDMIPWSLAVNAALAVVPTPTVVPPLNSTIGSISAASTKVKSE